MHTEEVTPMNPDTIYIRTDEVLRRQVVGQNLLVPLRGEVAHLQQIFSLNETGDYIWERLDGHLNVSALAEAVAAEFETTREAATADVSAFLDDLETRGLVNVA